MLSDIIGIGDKVEIRILQEVLQGYEVSEKSHFYITKVHDVLSDDEVVLAMPMAAGGKVILLPMDIRYDICFYTKKGLYHCTAVIKDRYKIDALYELVISLTSPLQKYQRRKFYRIECMIDFRYYIVDDPKELAIEDVLEAYEYHIKNNPNDNMKHGTIVDISGGGIRSVIDHTIPKDEKILLFFNVSVDGLECKFGTFARVVTAQKIEHLEDKYEVRMEFLKMDRKEQEKIVRYVFQEERTMRQNQKK